MGNGRKILFWDNAWLEAKPLNHRDFAPLASRLTLKYDKKVCNYLSVGPQGSSWLPLSLLDLTLPMSRLLRALNLKLKALFLPQTDSNDSFVWGIQNLSLYTVKSGYLVQDQEITPKISNFA